LWKAIIARPWNCNFVSHFTRMPLHAHRCYVFGGRRIDEGNRRETELVAVYDCKRVAWLDFRVDGSPPHPRSSHKVRVCACMCTCLSVWVRACVCVPEWVHLCLFVSVHNCAFVCLYGYLHG